MQTSTADSVTSMPWRGGVSVSCRGRSTMYGDIDTSVTIGGRTISTPIFGAPTAYHRLASKNGEITSQNGMNRAGTFIVYPTNASEPIEHFAAEAQGDWRQQVYLFDNRKVSEAFIERSVASGAKALMLTLDCPGYRRDFGFRNGIDGTWEGDKRQFPEHTYDRLDAQPRDIHYPEGHPMAQGNIGAAGVRQGGDASRGRRHSDECRSGRWHGIQSWTTPS